MFTEAEIRRIFKVSAIYGPGELIGNEWVFECFFDSLVINIKEWKAVSCTKFHAKQLSLRDEHMERQVLRTIRRHQSTMGCEQVIQWVS